MTEGIANKLVKGSVWLTVAGLIINLLQALSTIIVALFLTPDDYGIVAIAMSLMAIIMTLTNMQLGEALIRQENPGEQQISAVWTLNLLRGLILAALLISLAWPLADFYDDPRLVNVLLALSISPFFLGLENPKRFMLQRDLVFHQEFMLTVLQRLAAFLSTVIVAAIWKSYWALIIGNIIFNATGTLISYIMMRYRPRLTVGGIREIFGFSLWITLGQMVNTLNSRLELLLMGRVLGMNTLGLYSMGANLAWLATEEMMRPLRKVVYPGFTKILYTTTGQADPERLRNAYQRAQALVTFLILPLSVGFALVAEPLILLIFPERWHPVTFILQCLSAVFGLQTLGTLARPLGMAKNQTRRLFFRDVQMLFLRLPVIIVAMSVWGLMGVLIARIFTGLMSIAVNLYLIRSFIELSVKEQLMHNLRALFSVAIMSAAVLALGRLFGMDGDKSELAFVLLSQIVLGIMVYVGTNFGLWQIAGKPEGPETELMVLIQRIKDKKKK